jgi:predicted methyltransferase
MAQGFVEKALRDISAVLKPGGVLGVEEHRAAPGGVQDPTAPTGYVTEAYVRALAAEAGLVLSASSEINANPRDTRDHPFGVWTLPPTRQSAPDGKPDNLLFDHRKYDTIGESDRMTLRFLKH